MKTVSKPFTDSTNYHRILRELKNKGRSGVPSCEKIAEIVRKMNDGPLYEWFLNKIDTDKEEFMGLIEFYLNE
jgi:hypothetical protein